MPRNSHPTPKAKGNSESRARLSKFLAQPLRLEEHGPPRTLNQLLVVTCAFVAAFVVWTTVTEIDETAVASGQVRTQEQVAVVQHLEGGIIADILVGEGDRVRTGQPLLRLAGQGTLADLGTLSARQVALALQAERLSAFVEKRAPDFSLGKDYPQLVGDQAAILDVATRGPGEQAQSASIPDSPAPPGIQDPARAPKESRTPLPADTPSRDHAPRAACQRPDLAPALP